MQIIVDHALCDGNGLCVIQAPNHFVLNQNDELHLLKDSVAPGEMASVQLAVQTCPKAAIRLIGKSQPHV